MTTVSPLRKFKMETSHPPLDDKMEVGTSPYPHPHAEDIEFELDPVREPSVDRSMADDGEGVVDNPDLMQDESGNVYNDDEMFDDETLQDLQDPELVDLNMDAFDQQELATHDDEEILDDYEGTGSVDMTAPQEESAEQAPEDTHVQTRTDLGQTTESAQEADDDIQEFDPKDTDPMTKTSEHTVEPPQEHSADAQVQQHETTAVKDVAGETKVVDFAFQETTTEPDADQIHRSSAVPADVSYPSDVQDTVQSTIDRSSDKTRDDSSDGLQISDAQSVEVQNNDEGHTHTNETEIEENVAIESEDGLHPITVVYLDQEMSMFPPMADDSAATFFLSDSGLAYEPLEKLLNSCREILGESLEHDDELVLDVPALGLHICEDSKYASQITLSQIVEVYLNLSHNEKVDHIEPFYCNLSSRVCLASQYAYLTASAQEGRTYSEITADYLDSPEADATSDSTNDGNARDKLENEATGTDADAQSGAENNLVDTRQSDTHQQPGSESQKIKHQPAGSSTQAETLQQEPPLSSTTAEPDKHEQLEVPHAPGLSDILEAPVDSDEQTAEVQFDGQAQQHIEPHTIEDDLDNTDTGPEIEDGDEDLSQAVLQDETGSDSSHTVQNESLDDENTQIDDVSELEGENVEDIDQQVDDGTDLYNLEDNFFANETDDYAVNSENPEHLADPDLSGNAVVADQVIPIESLTEHDESLTAVGITTLDHGSGDGAILNGSFEATDGAVAEVPVTPLKSKSNKRKTIEDEEELDLLDLSTPEPKRTRPS